jgi:1-acyl-sn-glycerol-3-phosphate acyltransferase
LIGLAKRVLGPPACWLWTCRIVHQDRLPQGPVIVVANHASALDTLLLGWALPRVGGFLAKAEILSWPVIGPMARWCGAIPAKRGVGDSSAITVALAVLAAGFPVVLHPEGSRSPDGRWGHQRIRSGAARLALARPVPIQPIGLIGTFGLMPRGMHVPRLQGQVEARFADPIQPEAYLPPEDWPLAERIAHVNAAIDRGIRAALPPEWQVEPPAVPH